MAGHVRRAAKAERRPVRILMDLGGPKLRTGPLPRSAAVLRIRPQRDVCGRVLAPARIGLRAPGVTLPVAGADQHIAVDARWLVRLREGDELRLSDAREARRRWRIVSIDANGALAEAPQTTYVTETTRLIRAGKGGPKSTVVGEIPQREQTVTLRQGDHLRLTRPGAGRGDGRRQTLPSVDCTLPEVFAQVAVGERIWFDDGRIGGVIRRAHPDELEVEVTQARAQGETLAGDKGINLPDSALRLPALTDKDIEDLRHVARIADMVGLSFVQEAADVDTLRELLQSLQAPQLGIVLKIETRRGFEHLPAILFAAMRAHAAGIMIARGDLAVECGYERLAEVQEEILWAAEAAHLPVTWATQVLESLAKTGLPSRAEITDAAMGERAECVMLNKGPHIDDAILLLADILRRMQSHQSKKRSLLRALHAWELPQA
jgi:pyruvate kinase